MEGKAELEEASPAHTGGATGEAGVAAVEEAGVAAVDGGAGVAIDLSAAPLGVLVPPPPPPVELPLDKPPPGMSKKQWKKMKRRQEKSLKRKQKKQEQSAAKRARVAPAEDGAASPAAEAAEEGAAPEAAAPGAGAHAPSSDGDAVTAGAGAAASDPEVSRRQVLAARIHKEMNEGIKVVFDGGFWDLMHYGEQGSLCAQLGYAYGSNRQTRTPFNLFVTSACTEMSQRMQAANYGFVNMKWWTYTSEPYEALFPKESLVYLTSDSPNVLATLDPDRVYIIGAFIDRNRNKGASFDKAKKQGIATARLPLSEHLQVAGSQVLTTNQVLDIMLQFVTKGDWGQAVRTVVPPRKTVDSAPTPAKP